MEMLAKLVPLLFLGLIALVVYLRLRGGGKHMDRSVIWTIVGVLVVIVLVILLLRLT